MTSELTNRDRAHGAPDLQKRRIYGRGTKVKLQYDPQESVFTLLKSVREFWKVIEPSGLFKNIHENQISQVLVDGHWINFSGNPREWKKVS